MQPLNHSHSTSQPIEMIPSAPVQPTSPMNVLYDPYSPVAIIIATCALVTAIGKVVRS